MDYGNKETVHFDKLRPLPFSLSLVPQLATRCHLAKLVPFKDGAASAAEVRYMTCTSGGSFVAGKEEDVVTAVPLPEDRITQGF